MLRSLTVLTLLSTSLATTSAWAQPEGALGSLVPKSDTKAVEAIQGTWKVVRLETDGKPESKDKYRNTTMKFQGEKATLSEQGFDPILFSYSINAAKGHLDLWPVADLEKKRLLKAVYELKGDSLKICMSIGGDRPTALTTQPGDDTELFVMTRLKQDAKLATPKGWKRFVAKENGFSVELPSEPRKQVQKVPTPAGEITVTMFLAGLGPNRMTYISLHQGLPAVVPDEATRKIALDSFRDEMLKSSGGKLKTETMIQFQGVPAREIVVDLAGRQSQFRLRVFIIDDDLFALMGVGAGDQTKNKDIDYYWSSFKQLKDGKINATN